MCSWTGLDWNMPPCETAKNHMTLPQMRTEKERVIIGKQQRTTAYAHDSLWGISGRNLLQEPKKNRSCDGASIDIDLVLLPRGQHANPNGKLEIEQTEGSNGARKIVILLAFNLFDHQCHAEFSL